MPSPGCSLRTFLSLACTCAGGCSRSHSHEEVELEGVLFAGCAEVASAGHCLVDTATTTQLTVHVPSTSLSNTRVELDGERPRVAQRAVNGGLQLKIQVSEPLGPLRVRRTDPGGPPSTWSLQLRRAPVTPVDLVRADKFRVAGRFLQAGALLTSLKHHPSPRVRGLATGLEARIALAQGNYSQARMLLTRSIELKEASGGLLSATKDRFALAFVENNLGRYDVVERILAPVDKLKNIYPAALPLAAYYRGLAAGNTGDLRRALTAFRQARRVGERLGMNRMWSSATEMLILTLETLGRTSEARVLLGALRRKLPRGPHCVRADALDLVGRLFQDLEPPHKDRGLAAEFLGEAAKLYRTQCPKARRYAYTLVRLGRLRLGHGDLRGARAHLARSRSAYAEPGVPLRLGQRELAADVELSAGKLNAAAAAFAQLARDAEALGQGNLGWSAELGWGRALERAGKLRPALEHYQAAENLLDRWYLRAPLGEGRGSFLGRRTESAERLVDGFLRLNKRREAAGAARRSIARSQFVSVWSARLDAASPDQRTRWYRAISSLERARQAQAEGWGHALARWERLQQTVERAEEQTRAILDEVLESLESTGVEPVQPWRTLPGTLVLAFHPVPEGWVGFATEGRHLRVRRLGHLAFDRRAALGHALLEPFAEAILRNRNLELIPFGKLAGVDVHALPWRGQPLVAHRAVAYPVEVGSTSVAVRSTVEASKTAFVLTPHPSLRASRAEGNRVSKVLRSLGWSVRRAEDEASTRKALKDMIDGEIPRWLHYAGHAQHRGTDGWESFLGNKDRVLWTIRDILRLPQSPRGVVLSACTTGALERARGSSLGLGQAFISRGAAWVVASRRPILDEDANILVNAFYRQVKSQGNEQPAEWLRRAQLELLTETPGVDAMSFRVLRPSAEPLHSP